MTELLFERLTKALIQEGLTVSTMESCTCGSVASRITDTEGASAVMKGAFITYSNEAKIRCGVPQATIQTYGVYSPQTAAAMAEACARFYDADLGIGITGSFGNPDPNNPDSVPGEVHFALWFQGESQIHLLTGIQANSRAEAKQLVAAHVAQAALDLLKTHGISC